MGRVSAANRGGATAPRRAAHLLLSVNRDDTRNGWTNPVLDIDRWASVTPVVSSDSFPLLFPLFLVVVHGALLGGEEVVVI